MELELVEFVQDDKLGSYYIYSIIEEVNGTFREIGRIVFRLGSTQDHYYDGHIGYSIKEEFQGQSKSFRACNLLKEKMMDLGYDQVVLTCDPANLASKKIITKLGATYLETAPIPKSLKKFFNPDEKVKEIYLWNLT